MKKIKLIVIFFFAIISILIIYIFRCPKTNNILILGENIDFHNDNYNIRKYLYDNITYKELINCIKTDEKIIIKNKEVSLNELIANTDYLIINANNVEYLKRCNNKVSEYYENIINNDKKKLILLLKRITIAKIIIIDNTCDLSDKVIDFT